MPSELAQYQIGGRTARELAESLEAAIGRGDLEPGRRLPSVRRIAEELGLSPTTVAAALAQLRSRGLVVSRERSGSQVSWRPPLERAWPSASVAAGARDLATGNPDPTLLPDVMPVLRRLEPSLPLYGADPVDEQLRKLGTAHFREVGIPGDHLAVVGGALDGIERTFATWLRPGDLVAVEDPGFPGVLDLCRAAGLALRPVAVDQQGMLPDDLDAALDEGARAVVITPRGQNPTGATLDSGRARALRRVLEGAPDVLVVEDDHLGPAAGAERHTLVKGRLRWAAALSVSKWLGPDLRLALLAGDRDTIDRVQGRQFLGTQWVSHLLQEVVGGLWTSRAARAKVGRAAKTYPRRRERLVAALRARGIEAPAASGLNVWVPVGDESSAVAQLLERGWAVAAGGPCRLRSAPAVRITIAEVEEGEADGLAEDVAAALRPVRRTRAA